MQATDIEIDGKGYPVVPGRYRRESAGGAGKGETGRAVVARFGKGLRRAVEAGEGAGWTGLATAATGDGAGVEPWPGDATQSDAAISTPPTASARPAGAIQGNAVYVGIGQYLYKSAALTAGSWAAWTQVANAGTGTTIHGVAQYGDDLLLLLGSGADILKFNTAAGTTSVWRSGERAVAGVGFMGQLLYANGIAGSREQLRLSLTKYNGNAVTDWRWLDAPIVGAGVYGGEAVIATRRSLWRMSGQPEEGDNSGTKCEWLGDPEPLFSHGTWVGDDDFGFLLAFDGALWTWLAGRVVRWDGNRQGGAWERVGPEGQACHGAAVCGGWLLVALTARSGEREVWAGDGRGWWRVSSAVAGSAARVGPVALGGCGGRDAAVFRAGTTTYDLYRLAWRSASAHTYPSSGEGSWTSGLIDAGSRQTTKTWLRAGATFAWPEARGNAASTDSLTATLEASADGGRTWLAVGSLTAADGDRRVAEVEAALPAATRGRWLQLRVAWSGVLDWAPVLTGVWAEWAIVPGDAPRRRWEVAVRCGDREVGRDGAVLARDGRQLAADLWAVWEAGATVTLRDIDHDATGRTHNVRLASIREETSRPADAGRWGESVVALGLVEV